MIKKILTVEIEDKPCDYCGEEALEKDKVYIVNNFCGEMQVTTICKSCYETAQKEGIYKLLSRNKFAELAKL